MIENEIKNIVDNNTPYTLEAMSPKNLIGVSEYACLRMIDREHPYTFDDEAGYYVSLYDVTCFSDSYNNLLSMKSSLRSVLSGACTSDYVIKLDGGNDLGSNFRDGENDNVYGCIIRLRVVHMIE